MVLVDNLVVTSVRSSFTCSDSWAGSHMDAAMEGAPPERRAPVAEVVALLLEAAEVTAALFWLFGVAGLIGCGPGDWAGVICTEDDWLEASAVCKLINKS